MSDYDFFSEDEGLVGKVTLSNLKESKNHFTVWQLLSVKTRNFTLNVSDYKFSTKYYTNKNTYYEKVMIKYFGSVL